MLRVGELVGERYLVECRIGQGGLAEVFRVRHRELGSLHALKLLTWRKQSLIDRMLLEGKIQAQIRHPNVVAVTDVVRHDGRCGLLMEYIDGQNLEGYLLRRGALPICEVMPLFAAILAAVTAAHDAGVLHRDLKPANVLLARTTSGVLPKVTDFGIAKVVEDMSSGVTAVGTLLGSPGYLAPEQVADSGAVDQRADIFALGVMLYEAIAGQRAFPSINDVPSARAAVDQRVPPLHALRPDCPRYISDAVSRAMQPDREARFADCRSLARVLLAQHSDMLQVVDRPQLAAAFSLDLSPDAPATPSIAPLTIPPLPARHAPPSQGRLLATVLAPMLVGLLVGGGALWWVLDPPPVPATTQAAPLPAVAPAPLVQPIPPAPAAPLAEPQAAAAPPDEAAAPIAAAPLITAAPPAAVAPLVSPPEVVAAPQEREAAPEELDEAATVAAAEAAEPTSPPPEASPAIDLTGQWRGTASSRPIQLQLIDSSGTLQGELTIMLGHTRRSIAVRGSMDPATSALRLRGGDFTFQGTVTDDAISGSYTTGSRSKELRWSVSR